MVDFLRDNRGHVLDRPLPKRVEVEWRLDTERITLGSEPRTLLQFRALREDVTVRMLYVQWFDIQPGFQAHTIVVNQEWAAGVRKMRTVKVRRLGGSPHVVAHQDLPHGLPDGPHTDLSQIEMRVEPNLCKYPNDYWQVLCGINLKRGETLGIVTAANQPVRCMARAAGV